MGPRREVTMNHEPKAPQIPSFVVNTKIYSALSVPPIFGVEKLTVTLSAEVVIAYRDCTANL